ncbi:MAG: hypothetical protein BGO98_45040 [Myxococcales bacterium 68-20]|nr:hypothetical protein [Myxococcales bacterium]OJY31057.1 MAG: hypothetical protein BGO98_45040 [Myxococcales bacterium 68-20]
MTLHEELTNLGVMPEAATALQSAAARRAGMLIICGPAGVGKTTVAELVERYTGMRRLGDLRTQEEIVEVLRLAEGEAVVGVVRSGESFGLSSRWRDMDIPNELVERASVMTVTLRRLPKAPAFNATKDLLLAEVLGTDHAPLAGSLAEQAKTLVSAGLVTDEAARFHVPGYE